MKRGIAMKKYVVVDGVNYCVDFDCIIDRNKKTLIWVNGYKSHYLSVYYREERTWNDHMGNTPCGYYVVVPFPNGKKRRVYMF